MLPKLRAKQPNVLLIPFIGIWVVVLDSQNRNTLSLLISGILILAVSCAMAEEPASRKSFFLASGIGAHVPRRHQPRMVRSALSLRLR